jgi:NhaP-type Na+/H+ or K+/H+ antiporter
LRVEGLSTLFALIVNILWTVDCLLTHYTLHVPLSVSAGYFLTFYPHHDISFDGKWFLRIMVPPIVFEAALSIDKRSFNRHVIPILMYAIIGTLMATGITAVVLHEGSTYFRGLCETIPYPEALTFGALISSIDPIAVLSVLSNMGMSDVDTIYVVIFGESLLNDGVAIVLFQTLVHFLDDNMDVDSHAVAAAAIHFLVVFIGSFMIGIASGLCCTVYYWAMHGCQTPLVEVLMFCCWALFPYYVCDGIEWSGIVSVVAAGFVMDIFVVGTHVGHESVFVEETFANASDVGLTESLSDLTQKGLKDRRRRNNRPRRPILSRDGLLSKEAKTHIGFVTEIIATMMETAIFAYLGLFLFSSRYHWNFYHVFIAISGCCISRAIMIPSLSLIANWITRIQQFRDRKCQKLPNQAGSGDQHSVEIRKDPGVIIDRKMQLVLWFAGLRGAMSFALVEDIPLYDAVTGEGTRLKSELKAMTSASIIFTVFILGGATFYMMEFLGLAPQQRKIHDLNGSGSNKSSGLLEREMEMIGLLSRSQSDTIYDKSDFESDEDSPTRRSPSPPHTLSDEESNPHDVYPSASHSTFESHAGNAPRRTGRPGTFRRQRQTQQQH